MSDTHDTHDAETDGGIDEFDGELADDIDDVLGSITQVLRLSSELTPMGMSEKDLVDMARTGIWNFAGSHPERAIEATAVLHHASGELLDKHTDEEIEDLARRAVEGGDE